MRRQRKLTRVVCLILLVSIFIGLPVTVKADQIKNADVFSTAGWDCVTSWRVEADKGSVQSMCETSQYIVCFQDGEEGKADTLVAFDRNTYERLFEVREMNYEHGNGMTYNPQTNEIYIAPYNTKEEENKGVIFAVDAHTLKFKRRIQVTDGSWNVASIEYAEDRHQYVIQTTRQRDYAFLLLDENFQEVDYLFPGDRSADNIFQDFCVSGDFIISLPYGRMHETGQNLGVQVYSISQRRYMGNYPIVAPGTGSVFEPQSICQSDAGKILVVIFLSGKAQMAIYESYVPVIYTVTTSVENGEITPTRGDVDIGSNYTVEYKCTEDYELKQVVVDGQEADIKENKDSYTFGNIQNDHNIFAKFTEIPKFDITTAVTNGTIDDSQLIRRDLDVTIHYQPDVHYEMDKLIIDGQETDATGHETEYTFEFIQGPHSVEALFKEIPSFKVSTQVYNGTITPTNPKVYRDENYRVEYQPDKDYHLTYMKIDGQWQTTINRDEVASSYDFINMQKAHDVVVVFQWKYMSLAILAGAFGMCIPMGLIYTAVYRVRKKRKHRK